MAHKNKKKISLRSKQSEKIYDPVSVIQCCYLVTIVVPLPHTHTHTLHARGGNLVDASSTLSSTGDSSFFSLYGHFTSPFTRPGSGGRVVDTHVERKTMLIVLLKDAQRRGKALLEWSFCAKVLAELIPCTMSHDVDELIYEASRQWSGACYQRTHFHCWCLEWAISQRLCLSPLFSRSTGRSLETAAFRP